MIKKYQTRFLKLSYLASDWTDWQLLGTLIEGLKPEIKGEVKAQQPRIVTAAISFTRIQEERLKQDARRMRTNPLYVPSHPSLSKKLTREELRDRSANGLYWHYDEPWSRDHRCKKGHLLLVEPIDDIEEV
ncbi:hypothetical protein B296_00000104 [Ensete ventricosum]|uniref:Uncharacterized protein n=1 Tax=Ensete ventricosum TaxID=4639 RepID=A0A426ZP99_ENSVE|nr:hypothetical protein B296_00000104 [Ensete ventricosum]